MKKKDEIQSGERLFKFIKDFGVFSVKSIQTAMEKADEKDAVSLEAFHSMVAIQMNSLNEGITDLLLGRNKLLENADFFVQKSGGQEFLNSGLKILNTKGIFDNIGNFFDGIFGGVFDTIKEILDNILDWLGITIPPWLECLIELICELPDLIGGLFSRSK